MIAKILFTRAGSLYVLNWDLRLGSTMSPLLEGQRVKGWSGQAACARGYLIWGWPMLPLSQVLDVCGRCP